MIHQPHADAVRSAPQPGELRTRLRRALGVGCVLLVCAGRAAPARAGDGIPTAAFAQLRAERDQQRLLAGHLLRRLGFGPNHREMHEVLRLGLTAYTDQQLQPDQIDDRVAALSFRPEPGPQDDGIGWQLRWLTRMAFSRRQLLEKMTLIWHEHFATSLSKVGSYSLMRDYERLLRSNALGNFRDLLIGITTDNAMLIYLDNTANDGQAVDDSGNRIPPNENYARELLQLFSLGVNKLNLDGTLVVDGQGMPVPAYGEADVKEIARALSGWFARYPNSHDPEDPTEVIPPSFFEPSAHDPDAKSVLGESIAADPDHGAADVSRVVAIIMHQPTTAPFIAKELIQKLATETPSPAYVQRVASVFATSGGDLRATVRAILTDVEFYDPAVLRSQYKEPIEHVVGALRGLGGSSQGNTLYYWTLLGGQLVYEPPTVFSFYRPGQKGTLVNAAYVAVRDQATDMLASGDVDDYFDNTWDARSLITRYRLQGRPTTAVDLLAQDLLAAPLSAATRQVVLDYIGPRVTEEKLRGAAWLIMCSPEYQVN
jgi:uncharacterized protein (DUF1800 family)